MKILPLTLLATLTIGTASAGYIEVYNNDSKDHTLELRCAGSTKEMDIRRSGTATYSFHSTHNECDVIGGTVKFPDNEIKTRQRWKIKNGKAKPM